MTDTATSIDDRLRVILRDALGIDAPRAAALDASTPLFGAMPELDSMAVAGLLTEIEDRMGVLIEDDEVDGEMLETFGSLSTFVHAKLTRRQPQ